MTDNSQKQNKFLDKFIDTLFNKTKLALLSIFITGFILRLIAARNIGVAPDDINHAIRPFGIFQSEKLVFYDQSTSLWYYIQGVFYKLFGPTMLGSRFASVLFGSLLIILMFFFVKKVFKSEGVAIISSALIAFSPLLIKETLPEMDVAVSFFVILSAYFMFSYLESRNRSDLILTALLIGIATMVKLYALFFAIGFFAIIMYKDMKNNRAQALKNALIFILVLFVLSIPTLTHNYLLYKEKGFVDFIFTNTLGIGKNESAKFYSFDAAWNKSLDWKGFFIGNQKDFGSNPLPGGLVVLGFLARGDPLLFIFGLIGLIISYRAHKEYFWFYLISFIPAFVYLGVNIPMAKHFIWGLALIAPLAGLSIEKICKKFSWIKLKYILIIILIFSLIYLGRAQYESHSHFYSESSFAQLVDYKSNIPKDALVVADSRIYRGYIHFGLLETNYIEAAQFAQVINGLNKQQIKPVDMEVYYIECLADDCGWGTIAGQQDFNASMEQISSAFANVSLSHKDFSAVSIRNFYFPLFSNEKAQPEYRIYNAIIPMPPSIIQIAKQTHSWYMYPEGYDRTIAPIFDDYYTISSLDAMLDKTAFFILYTELVLSLCTIIYIFYLFIYK